MPLIALVACAKPTPVATYPVGRIQTRLGDILVRLAPETPKHRESFLRLARSHDFDHFTFNRVIKDFVAQGGCPDTPEGFSASPYLLDAEIDARLRHVYGAFAAGRDDNPLMRSAGCQFYVVVNKQGLPRLDDKYTVYGRVIAGMDVVEAIVAEKTDDAHSPVVAVPIHVDVVEMTAAELAKYGVTER